MKRVNLMNIGEPMHESLKGIVQKIIFANEETGFSVAVVKSGVAGSSREITISGNLWNLAVGEEILAEGNWVEHPKYGKQFKASCYMKVLPTKVESIEAYLSSGMIKGLGPSTARKIVAAFGVEALDILSKAPHGSWKYPVSAKRNAPRSPAHGRSRWQSPISWSYCRAVALPLHMPQEYTGDTDSNRSG